MGCRQANSETGRIEPDGPSVPSPRAFLKGPLIRVLWDSYRMRSLCGRETDTGRVISERADSCFYLLVICPENIAWIDNDFGRGREKSSSRPYFILSLPSNVSNTVKLP
ncbi:uncharacterized protein NPIL_174651 [Nephila pilipes]|uniref:Uncharacterized protein n=1 Tax=Nephila pilipes TaxID=299642 RepID=A0A8X6TFJ6_NEPPI|nr:uncharacterized protein NPIL_174651 [Nephila pilipes]